MANLTISVNNEVLKRARIRALEENSSVNTVPRKYLEEYARIDEVRRHRQEVLKALLVLAEQCQCGREGKIWNRDELHER